MANIYPPYGDQGFIGGYGDYRDELRRVESTYRPIGYDFVEGGQPKPGGAIAGRSIAECEAKAAFIGAQQGAVPQRELSSVEQALAALIVEQRRTHKLLDELSSRLDPVIDHSTEVAGENPTPYPQTKSPLQAQIVGQAIEASTTNARLSYLLRVLTL